MSVKQFRSGVALVPVSADPGSPVEGQLQMSDGTARTAGLWQYTGAAWVQVPLSAGGTTVTTANKTTTATLTASDQMVTADASGGAFSITLPASASNDGQVYYIQKTDSTDNVVTIDGNASETIDGTTTIDLDRQYQSVTIISDGTNWITSHGRHQLDSTVRVNTGNGHGSTNNKIRRFTTAVQNVGTAITYADSAADGASFTINEDGVYIMSYTDRTNSGDFQIGISLNSAQLTTTVVSITAADRLAIDHGTGGSHRTTGVPVVLAKDDVIRAHTDGGPNSTGGGETFTITKIGRL
jgi:hypothetical protein